MSSLQAIGSLAAVLAITSAQLLSADDHISPLTPDDVQAGSFVSLRLVDGRRAFGFVDQGTDDQHLRLRRETPLALLVSGFRWDDVSEMSVVTGDVPSEPWPADLPIGPYPGGSESYLEQDRLPQPALHSSRTQPVQSLDIDAFVARWDRDAEADGLRLCLLPLNADGEVVPVRGSVSVELIGEYHPFVVGRRVDRRQQFPVLERWTAQIEPGDFDSSGTTVELPFRRFDPQQDTDIAPDGFLHVRLNVPGSGVYEASQDFLLLRPYSRIRDERQQRYHDRRFPIERP